MSDIPTTHKIPDALLGKLLHLSRAPTLYAPACKEAAAEITRLRADLAAAQEREQRMREAAARNLAHRADNIELDPLAFSGSRHQIARVLREEAANILAIPLPADDAEMVERLKAAMWTHMLKLDDENAVSIVDAMARAALSAMRGEQ